MINIYMFKSNKYSLCYFNIIAQAKARTLPDNSYVERHHIVPKSLGGSNEASNIVRLTAREHLICHMLLVRMTSGKEKSKMACAAWRMVFNCKTHQRYKVNARVYESIRSAMAESKKGSSGRKHTEETKQKIGNSKLGKERNITPEWRDKIIRSNTGVKKKPCSQERKQKISAAKTGIKLKPLSDEHRKKVADSKRGKKIQIDPVTGKRFYQTLV